MMEPSSCGLGSERLMRYRKPLVFASSGMIAGAASVALLTALMPNPTLPMAQASALAPLQVVAQGSAPMIGGPRTAAKAPQAKVPSPAVKPVSVRPTEGATAELGTRQEILKELLVKELHLHY